MRKIIINTLIWGSVIVAEYYLYQQNYSEYRILLLIPLLIGFVVSDLLLLNKDVPKHKP